MSAASTAVLAAVDAALVAHFGERPDRASVSFLGVDPVEVLRFEPVPGEHAFITLGMSRAAMAGAAAAVRPEDGPRGELLLQVRDPDNRFSDVWRKLAVLAAAPAVESVVYVDGMSVDLGEPLAPGSSCAGALVVSSEVEPVYTDAGPVAVLELLPATPAELAWCRVRGGAALRERWVASGTDLRDLTRAAAPLG